MNIMSASIAEHKIYRKRCAVTARCPIPCPVNGLVIATAFCCSLCAQQEARAQNDNAGTSSIATPMEQSKRTELLAPKVVKTVSANYPTEALAQRLKGRVEVSIAIGTDGAVKLATVVNSTDARFNKSALAAARQWVFEPAQKGDQKIESRITIPFLFMLPEVRSAPNPDPEPNIETATTTKDDYNDETLESSYVIEVSGKRVLRTEERSISDFKIDRDVITAAPRQEGAEVLRSAPGLFIGRSEGPAVAHRYMLRGFDADHGQDIEFKVAGLPINLPAHIHGQGYSDLGFLIGDVVQELSVTEGVYDPRQGDFAVAGSIDLSLGVGDRERGIQLRSNYGSWNTFRQLILWAPPDGREESFGAVRYSRTDGFGENRNAQVASGIFQHRFGEGELTYRAVGIVHTVRANMAGVVRQDDIDSGNVCMTCVYPFPTARAQNGLTSRFMTGLFADYVGEEGANGQVGFWFGYDKFRNQGNFTGFLQLSRTLARVAGRGDLIEQNNRTMSLGLTTRYRGKPIRTENWGRGTLEVGSDGRVDIVNQTQNLLDAAVRSQTWDKRVAASVEGTDLGFWGDLDWIFNKAVSARLGMRADFLSYNIDEELGNFAPLTRPQDSFIQGFRRSSAGLAFGPRSSVEVAATDWLSVMVAYGEGFRSPQARLLEDGERAPFSKVRSADAGVRFDWGDALQLTLGGYYTRLSDDIAFDAREGRPERIGATQRLGAVSHLVSRPFPWLVASASMTYVQATLLEPPPATAEEPQPPFIAGQNQPFVPPLVIRTDLGAKHAIVDDYAGHSLVARAGLGFSFLSPRPLPFGDFAKPVALVDASAGLSWGAFDLSFEVFNALNTAYAAAEYAFPSDWSPNDGVRARVPARHIAAGSPLAWSVSLGVSL